MMMIEKLNDHLEYHHLPGTNGITKFEDGTFVNMVEIEWSLLIVL